MNNNSPYSVPSLKMTQVEDPIDPGFIYPDTDVVISSPDDEVDPDFSVMPPYYPDYPVRPGYPVRLNYPVRPNYSVRPDYPIPCVFCNNNQWVRGGICLLDVATGYNPFAVYIDDQAVFSGLDFSEVTQYRQLSQGYHTFSIMGSNGYAYLHKSMYVDDGTATIAIANSSTGLDLVFIRDTACPTDWTSSCFRACNLVYYSGPVNASLGSIYFNSVDFADAASFSRLSSGNYTLRMARSAHPENTLVTTPVTLNLSRIYTLHVLNWNPSADAIQTLLVEDRRS